MDELKSELNAEIEILEEREKQAIKNVKNLEKSKLKWRGMEAIETNFISYILVKLMKTVYTRYTGQSKMKSSLL